MRSLTGFLAEPARLTESQIDGVLRAVAAIKGSMPPDLVAAAMRYPRDRSCFSCDHFAGGESAHCREWGEDVPLDARDGGCDRWRDEGVPI